MRAEEVLNKYQELKKEQAVLKFQLSRFKGITEDDIIESMTFSHADGERVQTSGVSDKTGKIAVNYKKIADWENDEWHWQSRLRRLIKRNYRRKLVK